MKDLLDFFQENDQDERPSVVVYAFDSIDSNQRQMKLEYQKYHNKLHHHLTVEVIYNNDKKQLIFLV